MNKQKKGISLIVLVITIIVMLILASAIIITLSNTNIITKAREAVLKTDVKNFEQELSLAFADKKLKDTVFDLNTVNATSLAEIEEYIPSFDEKYVGKLFIQNGQLVYDTSLVSEEEKIVLESMGIKEARGIITQEEAEAIKQSAENTSMDITVFSTDVKTYVADIPEEYVDMFTICQGKLCYRYEKTTYEERLVLYAAGIPCLLGDVDANGILNEEDALILEDYETTYEGLTNNMLYIGDVDNDFVFTSGDGTLIEGMAYSIYLLEDYWQEYDNLHPDRIRIVGDWFKINESVYESQDSSADAAEYEGLVKYIPTITQEYASRVSVVDGLLYFRYDKLTQTERETIINEIKTSLLVGDGNCDGYITEEDLTILDNITQGTTATDIQQVILDINNDGTINLSDYNTLDQYLNDSISYQELVLGYFE